MKGRARGSHVAPLRVMWVLGLGWAPLGGWGLPAPTQGCVWTLLWGGV